MKQSARTFTSLDRGQTVLLGAHVIQTFPGAVTALSFRGRRPWQK
jgi:hypothetical protein